jgi:hypothetical protein
MVCKICKRDEELRLDVCFDCANDGERVAANRTVLQHVKKAIANTFKRQFEFAKYDISWAWQRLRKKGDYSEGGYFDNQGHDWR